MRSDIQKKSQAISGNDAADLAWHQELMENALEISIGASRLVDALRLGPPATPPPRSRTARRRGR